MLAAMLMAALAADRPAFARGAGGQEATGTLSGVVVDATAAAIADVEVIVVSAGTGLQRSVRTTAEGTFLIPLLPPGQYVVTAQREGFAAAELDNVAITINDVAQLRIELKVAAIGESVLVTAQKRGEERLQDVPVPVTSVNAQELAAKNQLRIRDYFASVPGLSVSPEFVGSQVVAIRGITTSRAEIPTVGVMVDEVPFGSSFIAGGLPDIDPNDLARIEVLRGPQGTLYGSNSMGGLLKYVTREPSNERYSGHVAVGLSSVSHGDGPGYNVSASANVPLGGVLAVRMSGFTRDETGYVDNPIIGIDGVNAVRTSGGLLSALWRPSGKVSVKFNALYQDVDGDGSSEVDAPTGSGDLQQNGVLKIGEYHRTVRAYGAVLKAAWGRIDLTSITGYNVNDTSDSFDNTGRFGTLSQSSFGVAANGVYLDGRTNKFVEELRVSTPLMNKLEALFGGFYTQERYIEHHYDPAVMPTGAVAGIVYTENPVGHDEYTEVAAFANFTYHITDRFDVQFGARQSHAEVDRVERVRTGPLFGLSAGQQILTAADHSTTNAFTYLLTPQFKVSPDLMVYARFASGYRPGLFNPNYTGPNGRAPNIPASFTSDSIRTYEVGAKGEFFEHRLLVDASLYRIDWTDLQLQVSDIDTGLGYKTNGAGAKSEGVELSVTMKPMSGFTIDGWIDYDNAVLTEPFPTGSAIRGAPGDRLPFSSRWSGSVSLRHEFPLVAGLTGFAGGAASYVDDRLGNFRGVSPPRQEFPSYTKFDFNAGVKHDDWMANVFVNNIADERGVLAYGFYPPYRVTYIQPRTVGLNISRSF